MIYSLRGLAVKAIFNSARARSGKAAKTSRKGRFVRRLCEYIVACHRHCVSGDKKFFDSCGGGF